MRIWMQSLILPVFYLLFSFELAAQVPVSKEPHHHVVFENNKIRILNVVLPPGDTTQYHLHSTPSVFICLTKTHTASQLINKQPVESVSEAGRVWFENLSPPHTRIHRVINMDTATYHVLDVELLQNDTNFTTKPLVIEHARLQIDTPWIKVYTIQLEKSEQVIIKEQKPDFILVALGDATISVTLHGVASETTMKPGQFYFIKANDTFTVINRNDAEANFALLEIK